MAGVCTHQTQDSGSVKYEGLLGRSLLQSEKGYRLSNLRGVWKLEDYSEEVTKMITN